MTMRRYFFTGLLLLLLLSLGWLALHGNKSQNERTALLTHSPWHYEKAGFDSDQDGYIDVLDPRIDDCEKDDLIIFNRDGSGSFNTGSRKCDPSDPPILPFLWSFENNARSMYFDDQNFTIETLSASRLEMYSYRQAAGITSKYLIILRH
jgi:hypothetical protein